MRSFPSSLCARTSAAWLGRILAMRKRILAAALAAAFALALPGAALADPDFGPGSSSAGPNDANGHCHPPGQTADLTQCK